jgi:hypothetical protein
MNPATDSSGLARRLITLCVVFVTLFSAYLLVTAVNIAQTTGTVLVTASDAKAVLSISQVDSGADIIGTGSTRIRLKPGSYTLFASTGSKQAATIIRVSQKQVTSVSLKLLDIPRLPSVDNIDFRGMSGLIDSGLTSDQITVLKQAFFTYKNSSRTVIIDTNSIAPGPRNSNSADPSFTINFRVSIDSKTYTATIRYADLSNVQLYLYDQATGSIVFDSGPPRGE